MSQSLFYKGLSWLLLLNVAIKPLWLFGIERMVQNRVGYEAYGTYFSLLGLCVSLGFLADVGLTNMMNRELANSTALGIKGVLKVKLLFSFLYVGIISLAAVISEVKNWSLLMPLILIQVLTSYLLFFRAIITARQLFKIDAWISVIDKGIMIICCGLLLYSSMSSKFSMPIFLYIQIGALVAALLVAAFIALKQTFHQISIHPVSLLKKGAPFMVLIFLMSMHNRIDAFLLGTFHANGAYEAGIYASAYRLLDAGNLLGYLVASYLVPYAARNLKNADLIADVSYTLRQALLFAAVVAVAFVMVYSSWVQRWLYPSLAPADSMVLIICMATLPAYYLTHIYGSLLTAKGALSTFILVVSVSLAVNVTVNFFLISKGAVGCCVSALISQTFCALGCMAACKKEFNFSLKLMSLVLMAGLGFLYWGLFYVVQVTSISIVATMAMVAVLTALLMFAWWWRLKKSLSFT